MNNVDVSLFMLGRELLCILYLFYKFIGRMAELIDIDLGLGLYGP